MPSMVVTLAPSACPTSTVQDLTAWPSICTTQAPHWLVSHPIWVPVSPRWSRNRCTSSVRSSTAADTGLPFTVNLTLDTLKPPLTFLLFQLEARRGDLAIPIFVEGMARGAACASRLQFCTFYTSRVGGV